MKNYMDRMLEARLFSYEDEECVERAIKEEKEALKDLPEDFAEYFMRNYQFHDQVITRFDWDRANRELKLWLYSEMSYINDGYDPEKAIVLTFKGVQKCQISWEGEDEYVCYDRLNGQETIFLMFFRYCKEHKRRNSKCPFECVIRMFGIEKFRVVFTGLSFELNKSEEKADHSDEISVWGAPQPTGD